jgi:hypothetical protein
MKATNYNNSKSFILLSQEFTIETEYKFHSTRKWRFDYAIPEYKIAIEIEGGMWINGRHTRGSGAIGDLEKYNQAVLLGWRLLRFTPQQFNKGDAYILVHELIKGEQIENT